MNNINHYLYIFSININLDLQAIIIQYNLIYTTLSYCYTFSTALTQNAAIKYK